MQVKLFHYSEQDGLDADALEAQVLSASEVSVLLLATAASSYLWFDAEDCPRNVELCTILKNFPEIRVNFVVCPTTNSARDGWQQHQSDLQSVFGDFLPETGKVDTWTDFDPEQDIDTEQILSLTRRVARPLNHQDIHQPPPHRWPWQIFGVTKWQVLGMICLLWQQSEIQDLRAKLISHGKVIGVHEATISSHDQSISKLVSTTEEQSTTISHLNSASELHGKKLSALSSLQEDTKCSVEWCAREVGHLRAQMSECSRNACAPDTCAATFYPEKTQQLLKDTKPMEIPISRNQSLNAYDEMQCQNGQSPDQRRLEWWEGIGSTFALFLLHFVSF